MGKVVVIDGPAGSGKSTTAIALAKKLGFIYLDTGAMYRALTVKFLELGIKEFNDSKLIKNILDSTNIQIKPVDGGLCILLDDIDVTDQIRSNEVEMFVSEVSAMDIVRDYMHKQQRLFARNYNIIAEGRDLGMFVFPDADVKIFLVADLEVRTQRRLLQKNAVTEDFNKFRNNLIKRDRIDSSRKHSPLKKADDAIEIDTTNLTFDQQVQKIYDICKKKLK
jgi:cytidylate kinase